MSTYLQCAWCDLQFGNGYRYAIIDYKVTLKDSSPDGTTTIHQEDAGVFCSDNCLLAYIAEKKEDPPDE
ncbi:MAG: hypothetical protein ACRD3W_30360 [Terriglobales bacterium]